MSKPTPPESLPKYLREGIPKQDDAALRELSVYIDDLLEHREERRDLDREGLPDEAQPTGKAEFNGYSWWIVKEKVKCGDDSCHCANGDRHGPYKYAYRRDADGNLVKKYVDDKPHLRG